MPRFHHAHIFIHPSVSYASAQHITTSHALPILRLQCADPRRSVVTAAESLCSASWSLLPACTYLRTNGYESVCVCMCIEGHLSHPYPHPQRISVAFRMFFSTFRTSSLLPLPWDFLVSFCLLLPLFIINLVFTFHLRFFTTFNFAIGDRTPFFCFTVFAISFMRRRFIMLIRCFVRLSVRACVHLKPTPLVSTASSQGGERPAAYSAS